MSKIDYPPTGFRFSVHLKGGAEKYYKADASFSEVSGITAVVNTEEITEGGENRFKYRLPLPFSYTPLVLKRGVVDKDSGLSRWLEKCQSTGIENIELASINVILLNEKGEPLITWLFEGAFPLKYEISGLKADSNQLAIESFELSYRSFKRES